VARYLQKFEKSYSPKKKIPPLREELIFDVSSGYVLFHDSRKVRVVCWTKRYGPSRRRFANVISGSTISFDPQKTFCNSIRPKRTSWLVFSRVLLVVSAI